MKLFNSKTKQEEKEKKEKKEKTEMLGKNIGKELDVEFRNPLDRFSSCLKPFQTSSSIKLYEKLRKKFVSGRKYGRNSTMWN